MTDLDVIRGRIFRGDYDQPFVVIETVEKLLQELEIGTAGLFPEGEPLRLFTAEEASK